jgi:hypothetical protein
MLKSENFSWSRNVFNYHEDRENYIIRTLFSFFYIFRLGSVARAHSELIN